MITIDVNLDYISERYNISRDKFSKYKDKSVDEIMKTEAANGNFSAVEFLAEFYNDPKELIKILELTNPENRYQIIRYFNEEDMGELLPYLKKYQLTNGLGYFNKARLLELTQELPKEEILKVVFERFTPQKLISMLNEKELNNFFLSDELKKEKICEFIPQLEIYQLASMVEGITGEPANGKSKEKLIATIFSIPEDEFKEKMEFMNKDGKMNLIFFMTKKNPELFQEMEEKSLVKPLQELEKEELLKYMSVIKQEFLIKMVQKLPKELVAITASQIDPKNFSEILVKKYDEVLKEIKFAT